MSVAPDLLRAARETYNLEYMLNDGLSSDALEKAISAALEAHERTVLRRIANQAATFAHDPGTGREQAGAVLTWFSEQLLSGLGASDSGYEPHTGDLVEVTLTGMVETFEEDDDYDWSVVDDTTGDEYFFSSDRRRAPRVRVLTRNEED